jgi:hypothetical protein
MNVKANKIIDTYLNNRVQWMMENDCGNDREVLIKMMELYAESKLEAHTGAWEKPYEYVGNK